MPYLNPNKMMTVLKWKQVGMQILCFDGREFEQLCLTNAQSLTLFKVLPQQILELCV
jgi:hypothetical protein